MATRVVTNDNRPASFLEKDISIIAENSRASESESDSERNDEHENENNNNKSHTLRKQITTQTEAYILHHWPFETSEARTHYLSKDLPGLACLCFPAARDDRMHLIARLFAVVFLLGETIAGLDDDDAGECVQSLREAARGYWEADRTQAEVWMLCDLFDDIRSHEYAVVDDIMDATWRYLGLRMVRRGRRTERDARRPGFQDSFMAAGMLLPLYRFATGVAVDEDECNCEGGSSELLADDVDSCTIELRKAYNS